MAKHLPPDEWAKIRERWELDPRAGFDWLVDEMNLPITVSGVKTRARRECWGKRANMKAIVDRAQRQADERNKKHPENSFDQGSVDVRANVLGLHRDEWADHRAKFPMDAIVTQDDDKPSKIKIAEGGERIAKTSKIMAETIRIRQQGEREAWGLDSLATDEGVGMSTLDELDAMFKLAMKQSEEMKNKVRTERGDHDATAD